MAGRRIAGLALAVALVVAGGGCSGPSRYTPEDHGNRQVKAEALTAIKIRCHQDVWARTGQEYQVKAKVTKNELDFVTVELSGSQLSELLDDLDKDFDEPSRAGDPAAKRMYEALAPVIDGIKPWPPADDLVPEVIVG